MRTLLSVIALLFAGMSVCQNTEKENAGSFVAATYNIRYANSSDSAAGNGWGQRFPVIAQLIKYHNFDVFGTQEGLKHQLNDLKAALPDYDYFGVGREDGKVKGEHCAIFYRTDRFEILEHGDFWLSETPDVPSVGWDAALERICSWGKFRNKNDGFEFLMLNLHMDHVGEKARVESAHLVLKQIEKFGKDIPVILTGDFNVDQNHVSYAELTKSETLRDAFGSAQVRFATTGTFNDFDPNGFTESRIDHIFLSPVFEVNTYGVLTDSYRGLKGKKEKHYIARLPSDHFPVRVELRY